MVLRMGISCRRMACLAGLVLLAAAPARAVELDALPELALDVVRPELPERPPRFLFGYVGGAVFNTSRFPGSDERVTFPFPLMFFNYNDRVFWSIASVGGWLWRSERRDVKLGLLARSRGGIRRGDVTVLGIDDRDPTVMAGANVLWRTPVVNLGASWLYDVGGRSQGQSATLRLSRRFVLGRRWSLTPSAVADWWSRDLADYYYGVDAGEVAAGAPAYEADGTVNLILALTGGYRLTKHWSLNAGVSYTRLGNGIADSPITDRRDNLLVFLGAGWTFLLLH